MQTTKLILPLLTGASIFLGSVTLTSAQGTTTPTTPAEDIEQDGGIVNHPSKTYPIPTDNDSETTGHYDKRDTNKDGRVSDEEEKKAVDNKRDWTGWGSNRKDNDEE